MPTKGSRYLPATPESPKPNRSTSSILRRASSITKFIRPRSRTASNSASARRGSFVDVSQGGEAPTPTLVGGALNSRQVEFAEPSKAREGQKRGSQKRSEPTMNTWSNLRRTWSQTSIANIFHTNNPSAEETTTGPNSPSSSKNVSFDHEGDLPDVIRKDTKRQTSTDNRPFVTFLLRLRLVDGHDLVIRDASGSSDPYVKFKYKENLLYKSNTVFKNLNPTWDETFSQLVDDPTQPIVLEVFDYDRFAADDFMGSAEIDLSQISYWKAFEHRVMLQDDNSPEQYMGYINVQVTIEPQTENDRQTFIQKTQRDSGAERKTPTKVSQMWTSVVNIVLVEAKNLLPTDRGHNAPLPDPYVKFKLGTEKYKSKLALRTVEPKWLEQFDMHVYNESDVVLEMMVYDKRTAMFMGRGAISVEHLEREITHQQWYDLEDGAGSILLLLSISGTVGADTVSDLSTFDPTARQSVEAIYTLQNSFSKMKDIGHLTVKVFKGQNLSAADIGGKSDPFCVLELVNARLQTHTEYKTLNPEWNKIFTFNVKDVHAVLEVTVYDEDPNKKVEFLGKVAIPLLKIHNGEKRWYALKDRKMARRSKGQILLECDLVWNAIRAAIRTVNPRETKYIYQEPKFKRQELMRNVNRVKSFALAAVEVGDFMQSLFSWDSPLRSAIGFVTFMFISYSCEIYMLPLSLLLLFVKSYLHKSIIDNLSIRAPELDEYYDSEEDEDMQGDQTQDERKSLKDRFVLVQDTLAQVQNSLDFIASLMERPYLSWLAIFALSIATVILYFVPVRWLVMAWGVNKFTKKLRNPHAIPNNELLDFLSRVPCDTDLRLYGEFRPDPVDHRPLPSNAAAGQSAANKKSNLKK